MKIRKEQVEALARSREDAYVARMVAHLRDDFPAQRKAHGIREADLESLVRQGMVDAEKHGVVCEDDVQVYLECKVILGPAFDRDRKQERAGEILRRTDLDGGEKMAQISGHLVFEVDVPPTDEPLGQEAAR